MSDEQAAVILLSASDLAIMKKQYVSSFVGRGILLSNKLLWRFVRFFCFVLFFFRWNCIFYSILELKRFSSGAISSFAKKNFSSSFQFWTDANIDRIWRAWYNGSYTMMAEPIKTLELHYPVFQFLIIYNVLRDNIRETYIWSFYCSYSSLTFFI